MRYAGDFIPSWAGAISIDLMPAVLVLILCVVHADIRREGEPRGRSERDDRSRADGGARGLRGEEDELPTNGRIPYVADRDGGGACT